MSLELYFLRSSEQKIVTDMLYYSQELDTKGSTLSQNPELDIYHTFYGLTSKDLGLYAMQNAEVCGAIWSRKLNNEEIPFINIAVKPPFRDNGVGSFMMQQFIEESSALYEALRVDLSKNDKNLHFFKKFGFEIEQDGEQKVLMKKTLQYKEVHRPSDGYDPRKWMGDI
jgi:ribosomal protein S18 acetylase RimI-like enzyme